MKPWQNVISTRRGERSDTGLPTVIQRLACGHEFTFSGQAALTARTAERRKCSKCPDIPKATKSVKRRSAARSYILISDAEF